MGWLLSPLVQSLLLWISFMSLIRIMKIKVTRSLFNELLRSYFIIGFQDCIVITGRYPLGLLLPRYICHKYTLILLDEVSLCPISPICHDTLYDVLLIKFFGKGVFLLLYLLSY